MTNENKIRAALAGLKERVLNYDRKMDGAPPYHDDSRPPTGDDYNWLYTEVTSTLLAVDSITPNPQQPRGQLCRYVNDAVSLAHELADLTAQYEQGVRVVSVEPNGDTGYAYTFELNKDTAPLLLGYTPDAEEWMTDDIQPELEPAPAIPEIPQPDVPPEGQMWVVVNGGRELRPVAHVSTVLTSTGPSGFNSRVCVPEPKLVEGEQVIWTLGSTTPIIIKT